MEDTNWDMVDILKSLAGKKSPAQIEKERLNDENRGIHSDGSVETYLDAYHSKLEIYANIKAKEYSLMKPNDSVVKPDEIIKSLWGCPIKSREELYQNSN